MTGQRDRFLADTLLQITIRGDDPGVVIGERVTEMRIEDALGQRHADRRRNALTQRARRGFDTRRMAKFGMARRLRAKLAEILQLIDGHPVHADQMEYGIDQHRAMARRQHEAVAVRPFRVSRVELYVFCPEHRGCISHAHRHAGMARFGLFHRVHGQRPDRIGHRTDAIKIGSGHGGGPLIFQESGMCRVKA